MVEFLLVAPVFLLLVLATFETGLVVFTWANMENITRQAARAVATGRMTDAVAEADIVARMAASLGAPAVNANVVILPSPDDEVTVTVTLPTSEVVRFTPVGWFGMSQLRTVVSMHVEQ